MVQFCEQCNNPNPDTTKRFCSIRCRNIHNARQRPKGKLTKKTCPICGHNAYRINDLCRNHGGDTVNKGYISVWNKERDDYLRIHYPHKGPRRVAKELGLTYEQVLNRVSILKITLTKEAAHRIIHSKASEYMTNNNPMSRAEIKQKRIKFYKDNPDKKEKMITKLFEGHRQLEKSKPSKLELRLFGYLDEFCVIYDPHHLIKPKFIVDVKIGNLIIQADGDYWHGHPRFKNLTERQRKQQARDRAQDKYLIACGYIVIRVWESDMSKERIKSILESNGII